MIDFSKRLRQLAKTTYYQNFYYHCKELKFKLFQNENELTPAQMQFLHYLDFYASLYTDYAYGEVDELVFRDEIYEDSYHRYKLEQRKKEREDTKKELDNPKRKNAPVSAPSSSWVFRGKK